MKKLFLVAAACLLALTTPERAGAVAGAGVLVGPYGHRAYVAPAPPTGMTFWVKGDTGITYGTGGAWNDQSGNGYNLAISGTTSNISASSMNGHACPSWASTGPTSGYIGTTAMSNIISVTAFTLGMAFEDDSGVTQEILEASWITDTNTNIGLIPTIQAGSAQAITFGIYNSLSSETDVTQTGAASSWGAPHYVVATFASGVMSVSLDGATPTTVMETSPVNSAVLTKHMNVGSNAAYGVQGLLCEVIIYNSVSSTQTSNLETYLNSRWL